MLFNTRFFLYITASFSLLIFGLLLIPGCQSASPPETGLRSETDTLINAGNIWKFDSINTANYKQLKWNDTYQAMPNEKIDNKFVTRNGQQLIFELQNGDTLCLTNDTSETDSYVNYQYCTKLSNNNHWLILGYYYEWLQYEIVNCSNGKRTPVMGYPFFSADGRFMACCSFDESGMGFNGIEIWNLKGNSLQLILHRELTKWGPNRLAWAGNDTLLIERLFMLNTKPGYVKVGMPSK